MRISLVSREYAGVTEYSGGIGTQFAWLGSALQRLGHEVEIIAPGYDRERTYEQDGVTCHLVRPTRLGWGVAVDRRLSKLGRFDVVYAPEWGGDARRYARRKHEGPLVTNLTTSLDQMLLLAPDWKRSHRVRLHHAIQRHRERRQTEGSDAIVACTRVILDWARELWSLEGIESVVLPNMLDVALTRTLGGGEPPAGLPRSGPVVAFSGRLELRKGVDVLVEAMTYVWAELPEVSLVFFGSDWQVSPGQMMSQRLIEIAGGPRERMRFLGALPREQLFPGLVAADIVALPSVWENFSLSALETMALGRPLIATSGSGFSEFVEDGHEGILVPPRNARALADAILRLLGDPGQRARLGAAAARAAERYDVISVAELHASFFRELAARA